MGDGRGPGGWCPTTYDLFILGPRREDCRDSRDDGGGCAITVVALSPYRRPITVVGLSPCRRRRRRRRATATATLSRAFDTRVVKNSHHNVPFVKSTRRTCSSSCVARRRVSRPIVIVVESIFFIHPRRASRPATVARERTLGRCRSTPDVDRPYRSRSIDRGRDRDRRTVIVIGWHVLVPVQVVLKSKER